MTLGVEHYGDPDWFWEQSPDKQRDILIVYECKHHIAAGNIPTTAAPQQLKPQADENPFIAAAKKQHFQNGIRKNGFSEEAAKFWFGGDSK